MRLAIGAAGAATVAALVALVGGSALASASPAVAADPGTGADLAPVRHVVQYVVLAPGQLPPSGAVAAPGTLAVPVSPPQVTRQPKIRTTQSGTP